MERSRVCDNAQARGHTGLTDHGGRSKHRVGGNLHVLIAESSGDSNSAARAGHSKAKRYRAPGQLPSKRHPLLPEPTAPHAPSFRKMLSMAPHGANAPCAGPRGPWYKDRGLCLRQRGDGSYLGAPVQGLHPMGGAE